MKTKLKQFTISFIILVIVNLIMSNAIFIEMGIENSHVGLLYVLGLLFGPYGALGAVLGNVAVDLYNGYTIIEILPSAIISFGVSYLAYKIWYSGFRNKRITKPKLDNIEHLILFLLSIIICGLIYSSAHANLIGIFFSVEHDEIFFISYFMNFINIAFIFGVIFLWISEKIDFVAIPKTSQKQANKKAYRILFYMLLIVTIISSLLLVLELNMHVQYAQIILITALLFFYLTKPFNYEILPNIENTITEKIIRNFLIITLAIAIFGVMISVLSYNTITHFENLNIYIYLMPLLIITDVILILFFAPGIVILRYIENKVIKPISSFSEIEGFIQENEKIEAEGLVEVYSKYINEQNEIGTLARSYTDLINHNNHYIENIREIEGEKERINAELDIATKIQASALPTEAIENNYFIVNGYSKPAKEVGGDFFDYYQIDDENLAIIIGDASGKGVPAAILAMITQVIIKQLLKQYHDPSQVLYHLNNLLSEKNSESMFLTLWLGIYNKTTNELIFSNAGHNPPIIKEKGGFKYMKIDSGLVVGIMEDFDYVCERTTLSEEIIIYTDGITDANNEDNEMYGEERLINFFNKIKSDGDPIKPLLDNISDFTQGAKQYDDMTLLYLKIK